MTESAAPWLKAMENGGLGEARARAFLMDRFWVLERSVDVEGADYLIQQRLTRSNFLDSEPPRLGVVQVKYIQDGNTYIKVKKSYLTDRHAAPYGEFFVLIFTGREDDERAFLLSARDILKVATEIEEGGELIARLRGAKLLDSSNYEITQRKQALDQIEHALKNADFIANRRFIGSSSYVKLDPNQIDHDLTTPLDNSWCDISKEFFKGKKKLQSTMINMEEIIDGLAKMVRSTDPMEVLELYEQNIEDYVGGGGRELGVAIDFFDEDFFEAVKSHRARLSKIKELGLEGNYFKLWGKFDKEVVAAVLKLSDDSKVKAVQIAVSYDPESLRNASIVVTSAAAKIDGDVKVVESSKGEQVVLASIPTGLAKQAAGDKEEYLDKTLWTLRRPIQQAFDTIYLGEELAAW